MRLDNAEIKEIKDTTEGMLQRPNQAIWKQSGHLTDFEDYMLTIASINSLKPDSRLLENEALADYEIFTPFKGLVVPNKITVDGNDEGINLLNLAKYAVNMGDYPKNKIMTPQEFRKFSYALCTAFRLDKSQYVTSIMDFRKDVLLADVINRGVRDANNLVTQVACYPLHLNVIGYEDYAYQYKLLESFERQLDNDLKVL